MPKTKTPVPPGHHTLAPYLRVRNAAEAIAFYKRAFGAEEVSRMPFPGSALILHATLRVGDSMLMLCDEIKEWNCLSPQSLGGTGSAVHLYVPDVDAAFARAVGAGARVSMPLTDMFWGDRFGKVIDPFGHEWSLATHVEDLSPAQIAVRAQSAIARPPRG